MEPLVYNSENQPLSFEDFKNENGITYWWASDLMKMLGYTEMQIFQKVLDRVTKALVSLNIHTLKKKIETIKKISHL